MLVSDSHTVAANIIHLIHIIRYVKPIHIQLYSHTNCILWRGGAKTVLDAGWARKNRLELINDQIEFFE